MEKLKIHDELWLMENNKPKCFYVWEVIHIEFLTHQSNYGQPYDWKIREKYRYTLRDHKDNDYQTVSITVSEDNIGKTYFRTKQELLDSL